MHKQIITSTVIAAIDPEFNEAGHKFIYLDGIPLSDPVLNVDFVIALQKGDIAAAKAIPFLGPIHSIDFNMP